MAVSSITMLHEGQTGSRNEDQRTYEAVWMVIVTDPMDGPKTVTDALKAYLGKSWTGITKDIDAAAKCDSLVPTRVAGTRLVWTVKGTWTTPSPTESGQGQDGSYEDDPTKWREEVEWNAVKMMVPVEKATLHTPLAKIGRAAGSEGPVVNAAGEVFDPPPEKEWSHHVLRITKYLAWCPVEQAHTYDNAINSEPFTIRKPGLIVNFPKYTAKMEPIVASLNWHTRNDGLEVFYWKVIYEIHKRLPNWREQIANIGRNRRALPGDNGGAGVPVSAHTPAQQTWKPPVARIKDDDDFPVGPVLLDLDGQPLKNHGNAGVYLEYGYYPELPFGPLNL